MKLTDAKCPNCGANIEVNENLERAMCQYCGSTVMVKDAIEKYKIEISGKVEIDGIKGRNKKLDIAKKHLKLKEFTEANTLVNEIIAEDKFDVEAYCYYCVIRMHFLENRKFDFNNSEKNDKGDYNTFRDMLNAYERLKVIDENNEAGKYLGEYKDKIEEINNFENEKNEISFNYYSLVIKLNDIIEKIAELDNSKRYAAVEKFCNETTENLKFDKRMEPKDLLLFTANDKYNCEILSRIEDITPDGILKMRESTFKIANDINEIDELNNIVCKIEKDLNEYLEVGIKNVEIKKTNSSKYETKYIVIGGILLVFLFPIGILYFILYFIIKNKK